MMTSQSLTIAFCVSLVLSTFNATPMLGASDPSQARSSQARSSQAQSSQAQSSPTQSSQAQSSPTESSQTEPPEIVLQVPADFQVTKLTWKVDQPSPDAESMLRRFVEECVSISPGRIQIVRQAADSDLPANLVITNRYRICRFETTQELYRLVMGVNPSRWAGPRNSVEQVTYDNAVRFCEKLTAILQERALVDSDHIVRLPTDAEWEYACRAGAKTKYCFGDLAEKTDGRSQLDDYAWHTGNAAGNDPSVGSLKANRWQLADVHGYLWEFTQAAESAKVNPVLEARIWGGSWMAKPANCGCSSTQTVGVSDRAPDLGFRCVISPKVVPKNVTRQ